MLRHARGGRTTYTGKHRADGGASAVEYAILLAGAALAIIGVVGGLKLAMGDAISAASADQAVVADGSTVSASAGPTGGTPTPTSTPTPPTPTPTVTTPTPTVTVTTPAPTPTVTVTTPAPTPSPTPTAVPRQDVWTENYPEPNNLRDFTCTVTPSTVRVSGNNVSTGSCDFLTNNGPDRLEFDPGRSVPIGTVITVTWVFDIRNTSTDIIVTRTFVIS